jgi:hypothetical protein
MSHARIRIRAVGNDKAQGISAGRGGPVYSCADSQLLTSLGTGLWGAMTESADPGVHAVIEAVARDPSASHAGAVRTAFPRGVTCQRYVCAGGYCGRGSADGQDPAGRSVSGRVRTAPALPDPH